MNTEKTASFDISKLAASTRADAESRNTPHRNPLRALRRFVLGVCTSMLLLAGFMMWRAATPPLSDREQISAQMEEMRAAMEARSAGKIAKYISEDFEWNGLDARAFRASLAQIFMQWRDVKLLISSQKTDVRGASATTSGSYKITLREADASAPQTLNGDFSVQWNRTQSGWRIQSLRGGEALLGTLQN